MSYLDKIDAFCSQQKMSQTHFEKEAGIAKGLISKWRTGTVRPRVETLQKAAAAMKMPLEDLLSEDLSDLQSQGAEGGSNEGAPDIVRDSSIRYIPVYRWLSSDTDNHDPFSIKMYLAVLPENLKTAEECFGYIAADSSMAPVISAGDTLIVRKNPDPVTGDIVLVTTPGKETVCRKLIWDGDYAVLQPFNPHFNASLYRKEEFDLLPVFFRGNVVAVISSVRNSSFSSIEE